jgi:tetratricopeptide (TPR) repeat protein
VEPPEGSHLKNKTGQAVIKSFIIQMKVDYNTKSGKVIMKRKYYFILIVFLLIALPLNSIIQGTLKGVAKDKDGHPLEGVTVTISSIQYSSVRYVVKTNKKGEFIQLGLNPNYYQIKAEKDGYLPVILEKRVRMQVITEVEIVMEKGNYYVGKSPGEEDFQEGIKLFKEGKYEEAAAAFQRASEKEPSEPIYYNNIGESYIKLGKYDEAIEAFKKMLEIQPESYTANKKLGELYGRKRDYEAAIPYYQKAVELSPQDPVAFYDLGACLINIRKYQPALEALRQAVKLKPDYAQAYYQMGMIYVNQNQVEEALKNLEKFLELAPDDPHAAVARQLVDYLKKSKK